MSYQPDWLSTLLQIGVVAIAPLVLTWAASTSMLGLSRHVYVLASNRQVPSWLGKLGPRSTPYIAILGAAVIAFALALPDGRAPAGGDLRVRGDARDRDRPPVDPPAPLDASRTASGRSGSRSTSTIAGRRLPVPALLGALLMALLWLAVLVFHARARWVGGGWMLFGLVAYVVYRRFVERTLADEAGLRARGGAAKGRARGRVRDDPGAGLRDRSSTTTS